MNEPLPRRTEAETQKSWWPGWIWAVPIAAIGVAAWLGLRALARGGETVTVAFDASHGVKAGQTKVTLRGVDVGEVVGVTLADGAHGVRMKLRLDRKAAPYLRTGSRFWLEGAEVDLTDLSSIRDLLAGPQIAMEPGPGPRARRFIGLDRPPAMPEPAPGTAFVLTTDDLGALQQGSSVYYGGLAVGKVTAVRLMGPRRFELDAFVRAPYDRYVTTAARFWSVGAVDVSASGHGVKAQLTSPMALVAGGVAFGAPDRAPPAPRAPSRQHFTLYDDKAGAMAAPVGPQVPFVVRFDGAVGALKPGAAVDLEGFRVGQVTSVALRYDARTGRLETPVRIELEPLRLDIRGAGPAAGADWTPAVDAMMRRLVARGLRASLAEDPPLVGAQRVDLGFVKGARPAVLAVEDGVPDIPATAPADVTAIERQAGQVLTRLNQVPIERIGDDVRQAADRIRTLADSPKLDAIVGHVDSATAELDRTVRQVGPQVGPLVAQLRRTAAAADQTVAAADRVIGGDPESQDADLPSALHQLTETARSIRALADYLDRHPEALIRGKAQPKETP